MKYLKVAYFEDGKFDGIAIEDEISLADAKDYLVVEETTEEEYLVFRFHIDLWFDETDIADVERQYKEEK